MKVLAAAITFAVLILGRWIDYKCHEDMMGYPVQPLPWLFFFGLATVYWGAVWVHWRLSQ